MRLSMLITLPLLVVVTTSMSGDTTPAPDAFFHNGVGNERAGDLTAMSERSNLVFRGRVSKVDYRLSQPAGETGALAHTIVTYDVGDVLRGQPGGRKLTLRFVGGSDGRGRFLDVSGVPQFQVGDEDLLFVTGNGETECALVLCEWGRYRVLRGGVYNAHGFPVRAIRQAHTISRGAPAPELLTLRYPAPKFDELMKNEEVRELAKRQNMSLAEMRRRYEAEAPREITYTRVVTSNADGDYTARGIAGGASMARIPDRLPEGPMAVEEFTSLVKPILARATRRPATVRSIDPNAVITSPRTVARAPRGKVSPRVSAAPRTARERAEIEALRRQDFNPVIR